MQGRSDGVYIGIYTPKSAQVNFLWGKNDVRTAIQQFYTPPPQKKKTFMLPKQISGYASDVVLNNIILSRMQYFSVFLGIWTFWVLYAAE